MSANSFGHLFKMISFGESHGVGVGVVIEGCPSGVNFSNELLKNNLQRRKPGQSSVTTDRQENDIPEIISGVFENKTLGTPICILVKNKDQKSDDYQAIKDSPRIGHADDAWKLKFAHVDHRGGGRSSGRETLARVMAGSVAQMLVQQVNPQIQIKGFAAAIGSFKLSEKESENIWNENIDSYSTRFPSAENPKVVALLEKAKQDGESFGGVIELRMKNVPGGLGQPIFHKFKSDLASAMMSIGATAAIEIGEGELAATQSGQSFHQTLSSKNYGGIRGGITTGDEVCIKITFKPTSSIKDVAKKGRHDPCIIPRAVPVVEGMAWLVLADHLLWARLDKV